jgi:hydroxymethylpyrimidine pyrophosphatase-like HAD family hydrolase
LTERYNSEKKLPVKAKEAVFQARKNGHEVFIATGRAPFMIQDVLKELEIDSYICFNGQYIVHEKKWSTMLPLTFVLKA